MKKEIAAYIARCDTYSRVVGAKTCQCAGHTASQKDLLDGARLEIRLASKQG